MGKIMALAGTVVVGGAVVISSVAVGAIIGWCSSKASWWLCEKVFLKKSLNNTDTVK